MSEVQKKATSEKSDKAYTRKAQMAFLKLLREGNATLPRMLKQTGIPRSRLGTWLTGASFGKEVRTVFKRLDALGELDRDLYNLVLFDRRSKWLDDAPPTKENQQQVNAQAETAERTIKKSKPKRKREVRAHPDTPPETAQRCMGTILGDHDKKRGSNRKGASHG